MNQELGVIREQQLVTLIYTNQKVIEVPKLNVK
jgi:hypothetical protein